MRHHENDDSDYKWEWPHPADLGVLFIAGAFLAGMIGAVAFLLSSPEPVRDLFKKPATEQSQNNEVTVPLQQKQ